MSSRLYLKVIILTLQAAVLLFLPSGVAAKVEQSVDLATLNLELRQDGSLEVVQELIFASPTSLNWPIYGELTKLSLSGDGVPIQPSEIKQQRTGDQVNLIAETPHQLWSLTYRASSKLIRSKERDQLYFQVLRESGFSVKQLRTTFKLPAEASGDGLTGNIYAIGGVGQTRVERPDSQTLTYQASFMGPNAILTINAHWPKSVLHLSLIEELRLALENLEIVPFLVLGILLPLLGLAVLLRLLARQKAIEKPNKRLRTTVPSALSPLVVGTLVDKKVYPKEIVAMLIDLCQRGYIVIVKKSGQYYLSQRRQFDDRLEPWEQGILEALFPVANTKLTESEMRALNRQSLFNPKVRRAFDDIYEIVTRKQYFAENPHRTRVRYKLFALSLYYLSVIGAIWIAVTGTSPYLLLPVAGTMIFCRLILRLTPGLVRYTQLGLNERAEWLAFANYLSEAQPLSLEAARNRVFEKYLGYAIALGKTKNWAGRFDISEMIIIKPDWFISYEETSTSQFAREIEQFSKTISTMLTEMRGPLVN
ncbi:MAG: DUF2207 domain-containing protein [Candidatus Berkelbacteria bacterium]|nr:MAG: DUF2207 domain-containing protein [Candidatus Berkelbacteria bacterium]QQG51829.1 MAG: DUF2207 domain-containing protein [Candidatus Berkelbacteria bacterium]